MTIYQRIIIKGLVTIIFQLSMLIDFAGTQNYFNLGKRTEEMNTMVSSFNRDIESIF